MKISARDGGYAIQQDEGSDIGDIQRSGSGGWVVYSPFLNNRDTRDTRSPVSPPPPTPVRRGDGFAEFSNLSDARRYAREGLVRRITRALDASVVDVEKSGVPDQDKARLRDAISAGYVVYPTGIDEDTSRFHKAQIDQFLTAAASAPPDKIAAARQVMRDAADRSANNFKAQLLLNYLNSQFEFMPDAWYADGVDAMVRRRDDTRRRLIDIERAARRVGALYEPPTVEEEQEARRSLARAEYEKFRASQARRGHLVDEFDPRLPEEIAAENERYMRDNAAAIRQRDANVRAKREDYDRETREMVNRGDLLTHDKRGMRRAASSDLRQASPIPKRRAPKNFEDTRPGRTRRMF